MAEKVIIWGMGHDFYDIHNLLKLNEECGNIEIVAYVSKDSTLRRFEGREVITGEQIENLGGLCFDYIIVATSKYYKEIATYGQQVLGIERKKFINGKVLKIPYFNWKDYLQVYTSHISIVADWCYGTVLSNILGLQFNSPFVNVRVGYEWDDYNKLLSNLDYYMSVSPKRQNEGKYIGTNWSGFEGRMEYPKLWYDDIMLHGFHYNNQDEFYRNWEKRRKRYNKHQKLVMQVLYDERDLEMFRNLKFEKKLGFYGRKVDDDDVILVNLEKVRVYHFAIAVNEYVLNGEILRDINIFKLLLGDKNYRES